MDLVYFIAKKFLLNLIKMTLFQTCQTTLSVENHCSTDKKSLKEILVFL